MIDAIVLQLALGVAGVLGIGTFIGHTVAGWLRGKREFKRIRMALTMELHENALSAQQALSAARSHSFPVALLCDDAWRIALSNEQATAFGLEHVSDPVWQLSGLYARTKLVNQVTLARQLLVFSTVRASTQYEQILHAVDAFLVRQLEELIPATKKAEQNLLCEDFRSQFAKNTLMQEYAKVKDQSVLDSSKERVERG